MSHYLQRIPFSFSLFKEKGDRKREGEKYEIIFWGGLVWFGAGVSVVWCMWGLTCGIVGYKN